MRFMKWRGFVATCSVLCETPVFGFTYEQHECGTQESGARENHSSES